jgi:hypothetical protein
MAIVAAATMINDDIKVFIKPPFVFSLGVSRNHINTPPTVLAMPPKNYQRILFIGAPTERL